MEEEAMEGGDENKRVRHENWMSHSVAGKKGEKNGARGGRIE